jgi:hypothetical protein
MEPDASSSKKEQAASTSFIGDGSSKKERPESSSSVVDGSSTNERAAFVGERSHQPEKALETITVAYATDVEGNFEYWSRYIEISKVLKRLPTGELELAPDSYFVFGGDVVDRGPGDLRVLTDLVGLKRAYPDRVEFIMGNRDINKMRLPIELHKSSLCVTPRVYWVKPDEDSHNYLEQPASQADRLKWMLTKTMGSPLAFEYRRDELKLLACDSNDADVVESFVDLMRPDGLMMEYLKCAKIAVILGDTLFIHGAIHTYNMGWLPQMKVFPQGENGSPVGKPVSLVDFKTTTYDPMTTVHSTKSDTSQRGQPKVDTEVEPAPLLGQAPPTPPLSSSSSTSKVSTLLPLRKWVHAINQFALEEVTDFAENIGAYIEAADRELSATDVKQTDPTTAINRETITWAAAGGYDHPQPGSRLMQYAMGWMPDKSVNPSVVYANHLPKDKNSGDGGKEPSVEVARYLRGGHVNKVIVGHQPRGDAPLILDFDTGIQVVSADTSYAANTLWDMHNTGTWSSLPQRRIGTNVPLRTPSTHSQVSVGPSPSGSKPTDAAIVSSLQRADSYDAQLADGSKAKGGSGAPRLDLTGVDGQRPRHTHDHEGHLADARAALESTTPTTTPRSLTASLAHAGPIDTAASSGMKQKSMWSRVKTSLGVTAAMRVLGINHNGSNSGSQGSGGDINRALSTAPSTDADAGPSLAPERPRSRGGLNQRSIELDDTHTPRPNEPPEPTEAIMHAAAQMLLSESIDRVSSSVTSVTAITDDHAVNRPTQSSSFDYDGHRRSYVDEYDMHLKRSRVEEIVPLMWLQGKPQEENSRGIAVANILLRMPASALLPSPWHASSSGNLHRTDLMRLPASHLSNDDVSRERSDSERFSQLYFKSERMPLQLNQRSTMGTTKPERQRSKSFLVNKSAPSGAPRPAPALFATAAVVAATRKLTMLLGRARPAVGNAEGSGGGGERRMARRPSARGCSTAAPPSPVSEMDTVQMVRSKSESDLSAFGIGSSRNLYKASDFDLPISIFPNRSVETNSTGNADTNNSDEYPEPAPAVSQLVVYGILSQGIEYKYELPPARVNRYLGKKTADGWFIKARGIRLNAEEEAEVLHLARTEREVIEATRTLRSTQSAAEGDGTVLIQRDPSSRSFNIQLDLTVSAAGSPRGSIIGPPAVQAAAAAAVAAVNAAPATAAAPTPDDIVLRAPSSVSFAEGPTSRSETRVDPNMTRTSSAASLQSSQSTSVVLDGTEGTHPNDLYLITLTAGFSVKNRVVTEDHLRLLMEQRSVLYDSS